MALADDASKTLTVGPSRDYTTIQEAIDYIAGQGAADKAGWTITVEAGTYNRFTVLSGMDGLKVQAAEGATVTINTCDGSSAPAAVIGGFPDTGGVSIRDANNVTISGLNFNVGKTISQWYFAALSNHSESGNKGNNLTVTGCTFTGNGVGYGVLIATGTTDWTVTGCTFQNLEQGIPFYGDNTVVDKIEVSGNTFTDCSHAIHGYYGGEPTGGSAGTFSFVNNKVNGSAGLRSKVILEDQFDTGALIPTISGNTLNHSIVGLINLDEEGAKAGDVLTSNIVDGDTVAVDGNVDGTVELHSSYAVNQGSNVSQGDYKFGHW